MVHTHTHIYIYRYIYIYIDWERCLPSLGGARGSHWPLDSTTFMAAIENGNGERKKENHASHLIYWR